MTLTKKHLQNYFKRLRKYENQTSKTPFNEKIKYIACGEYGTKRKRPHYHAIVFNASINGLIQSWGECKKRASAGNPAQYVSFGRVSVDNINASRIRYIFKYTQKHRLSSKQRLHSRDDRIPEFQCIGQGIGKQLLDCPQFIAKHKGNIEQPYIRIRGGEKIAIPRYYKNRLYTDEERQQIADYMEKQFIEIPLTHEENVSVFEWKKEKVRMMHKKANREKNDV